MRSRSGTIRRVHAEHRLAKLRQLAGDRYWRGRRPAGPRPAQTQRYAATCSMSGEYAPVRASAVHPRPVQVRRLRRRRRSPARRATPCSAGACSARPYENESSHGCGPSRFIAFRCAVAASSRLAAREEDDPGHGRRHVVAQAAERRLGDLVDARLLRAVVAGEHHVRLQQHPLELRRAGRAAR